MKNGGKGSRMRSKRKRSKRKEKKEVEEKVNEGRKRQIKNGGKGKQIKKECEMTASAFLAIMTFYGAATEVFFFLRPFLRCSSCYK